MTTTNAAPGAKYHQNSDYRVEAITIFAMIALDYASKSRSKYSPHQARPAGG